MSEHEESDHTIKEGCQSDIEDSTATQKNVNRGVVEDDEGEQPPEEIDKYWPPPIEEKIRLVGSFSGKTLSAFAFGNAGSRFIAGGHDHELKIWDFKAMSRDRPLPIGNVQPLGGAVVNHLEFSHDDKLVLVIPANCQAYLMGSDGVVDNKQGICAKGDQYISDMSNTKGHVQMLNHGCWRPKDNGEFITCSNDATVRIWDPSRLSQQKTVIKTRSPANGLKTIPNVCTYSRDELTIVAGCQDGSVMIWDTRRKFISSSACIRSAHLKGSEISGLAHSYDMSKLCTRSQDESCKVWDLRQLKRALASRSGLVTSYSSIDCCFSPDDRLIMTGTSGTQQHGGEVLFMDSGDLSTRHSEELAPAGASVLRVRWHPKINHLAYTSSDGQVYITYDSRRSGGAGFMKQEAHGGGRGKKRRNFSYDAIAGAASATSGGQAIKRIITPHALPLFRDDSNSAATTANNSGGRGRSGGGGGGGREASNSGGSSGGASSARDGRPSDGSSASNAGSGWRCGSSTASRSAATRADPKRSYKPEVPANSSQGGRSLKPAGSTLSSYIARSLAKPGG